MISSSHPTMASHNLFLPCAMLSLAVGCFDPEDQTVGMSGDTTSAATESTAASNDTVGGTANVTSDPTSASGTESDPQTSSSSSSSATESDDADSSSSTGDLPPECGSGLFPSNDLPYGAVAEVGNWGTVGDVELSDLDNDGRVDLVVSDINANAGGPAVRVLMGQAGGAFGPAAALTGAHYSPSIVVGSIADAVPDLVSFTRPNSTTTGSVVRRWRGQGDGTFASFADVPITPSGENVTLADLDGDARLDAITSASTQIDVLMGTASETFEAADPYPSPWAYHLVTADLDDDGAVDVVAATSEGAYVYWGVGDGTLETPSALGTLASDGAAVGDFNGDLFLDVAVGGEAVVEIFAGDGQRGFAAAQQLTVLGPVRDMKAVDLDNDGCSDIVVAGGLEASGSIGIVMSLGEDAYELEQPFSTSEFDGCPIDLAVADIDGDEIEDFVVGTGCIATVGRALVLRSGG